MLFLFENLKSINEDVNIIPADEKRDIPGARAVKALDDLHADEINQEVLIPDNACVEIELMDIGEHVVLDAIDSTWILLK